MEYRQKLKTSRQAEYQLRCVLAYNNFHSKHYTDFNEDVNQIPHFRGCFTKSLLHDKNGKVDKDEAIKMLKGIRSCKCYFDQIQYGGKLRLVNPSCIYSWDLIGPFKSSLGVPVTPSITSAETAVEMMLLYEMALLRDVPFYRYELDPGVACAITELNAFLKVTPRTLFRGDTKGDLIGPYVSQFLWLPFSYGIADNKQKYRCDKAGVDFMTTWENALSVQSGTVKEIAPERGNKRYIITLRDGATYVHLDDPLQLGLNASLILNALKCPRVVPYSKGQPIKEAMFVDLGSLDLHVLMCEAVRVSMLCTWYHKWNILKIRPEALGMEVHRALTTNDNTLIHENLLSSPVLKRVFDKWNSYLLPQAYPEGAPSHPAYPGGHATFAAAMTAILKALYDENFMIDVYAPNEDGSKLIPLGFQVRVGDELDKLASNISIFRNGAGVHYPSDSKGLELGEEIAILILKEAVHRYSYDVTFKFHKRNGELVEINNSDH